jgi:hypothetical protein
MGRFPTPGAYLEALQFPEDALLDERLRSGQIRLTPLGLPRAVTGASAIIFPLDTADGARAVRCFTTEIPQLTARYAAISACLADADLEWFIPFRFLEEGVLVEGESYPVLEMEWFDGVSLNRYVRDHLEHPEAIAKVLTLWRKMARDLDERGIAHGDLQHGNVLIGGAGDEPALRLIDYDAMYVPALRGRKSPEIGHRNYQHPARSERHFGPGLDRFSLLVIDVALEVARQDPALWRRYDRGENMLFSASDFYDPSSSRLLEEFRARGPFRKYREGIIAAAREPIDRVPSIEAVERGEISGRRTSLASAAGEGRPAVDRLLVPGILLAVLLLLTGVSLASSPLWVSGAVLLFCTVVAAFFRYRRLPQVARRRRLLRERRMLQKALDRFERERQVLEAEREVLRQGRDEHLSTRLREVRQRTLQDRLKYHFIGEAGSVAGIDHKVIVRLKLAGIRNACHITERQLSKVTGIGDSHRERLKVWRAGLEAGYRDDIPEALPPSEVMFVERRIAHGIQQLDERMALLADRRYGQARERDEIDERLNSVRSMTLRRFVAYLLLLETLPPYDP